MIDKAPPGPIKTRWGLAFRGWDECVAYIRSSNSLKAPPGGVVFTADAKERVGDSPALTEFGLHRVRGVETPIALFVAR